LSTLISLIIKDSGFETPEFLALETALSISLIIGDEARFTANFN
jgi:hypothetical protein